MSKHIVIAGRLSPLGSEVRSWGSVSAPGSVPLGALFNAVDDHLTQAAIFYGLEPGAPDFAPMVLGAYDARVRD